MKTKLTAILIATASLAHANLVDLTPGGYNPDNGLPPAYFELQKQLYFDSALHGVFENIRHEKVYINGWVSLYGVQNGGIYFFTSLISGNITPAPSALIWWSFNRNRPPSYRLTMVLVEGRNVNTNEAWDHIYGVPNNEQFLSPSQQLVTIGNGAEILSISFYGQ